MMDILLILLSLFLDYLKKSILNHLPATVSTDNPSKIYRIWSTKLALLRRSQIRHRKASFVLQQSTAVQ